MQFQSGFLYKKTDDFVGSW